MLQADRKSPKPRWRRYGRRTLLGLLGVLGLIALLLVGILTSLHFARVRRYVVRRVNAALLDSFKGRIEVSHIQRVDLSGVRGVEAQIFDPSGRRVLDIHGAELSADVPRLLWSALTHDSRPLTLTFARVSVSHVEAVLLDDGTGSPTLADTFLPKFSGPPSKAPGTVVSIPKIELDHVWAHGALAGTAVDVELRRGLGSLRSAPDTTQLAFERVAVQARGLPLGLDPVGQLKVALDLPAAPNTKPNVRGHYTGSVARVPIVLDASFLRSKLRVDLESKSVLSTAVRRLVPTLELRQPAAFHAHLEGELAKLQGSFALTEGAGTIAGDFTVKVADDVDVEVNARARALDASDFSSSAPSSRVNLTLQSRIRLPKSGPMTGDFDVASESSQFAEQAVPPISLHGNFNNDEHTSQATVDIDADIAEPGAPTHVEATLSRATRTNIEFRVTSKLDSPPRLKRLAHAQLRGELSAQGNYHVEANEITANARATLSDISQRKNHGSSLILSANVSGPVLHPNVQLWLSLSDATLFGQHLTAVKLALRGSLSHAALSAEADTLVPRRHLQLSAFVSNDRGLSVDHPSINLSQGATDLRLSARHVAFRDGRTSVEGLRLEGAGTADASLVYGTKLERASVQTHQLELARLWHLVDKSAPLRSGTTTLELAYEQSGEPRASLKLHAERLAVGRMSNGSIDADLALAGGRVDGTVAADLKQLGKLHVEVSELRGLDLDKLSPTRLSGTLQADGNVDLRDLSQLAPPDSHLPIARARGAVRYTVTLQRESPGDGLPFIHVHVSSKELQLAGARDSKVNLTTRQEALAAAPPSVKGIDFDFDFTHEEAGATDFAGSLRDQYGLLGSASIESNLKPKLSQLELQLARNWRNVPLKIRTSMPPREIEQLPVEIRPAGLSGTVSGEIRYDGTLNQPDLKIAGRVQRFRQNERRRHGLDLAWEAAFKGTHGMFRGTARVRQREVGTVELAFETTVSDWLSRGPGVLPKLNGQATLALDQFPIALIPGTQTSQLDGALSGKIKLDGFGKNAVLDGKLEAKPFKVGASEFASIITTLKAQEGSAHVELRVEDQGGVTTASAQSGLDWGARWAPQMALPADAEVHARGFRLAALAPFLTSSFGELDGRVDGDLNAHFRGGAPQLDGHLDLIQGAVQIAALGQRFDQIAGRISLVPGKVKLERLSAHATTGQLDLTAEANLAGLNLISADAHARISKGNAISLSVAGMDVDHCWGAVDLTLQPGDAERSTRLTVKIPSLHLYLPDTGSQDVQSLDPAKNVRVGAAPHYGDFVTLPLQPLTDDGPVTSGPPVVVALTLGDDIWLERGDQVKAQLSGKTQLVLADPTRMTGQIALRGGKLDVQGKQFEIESGTITFSGEPGNPTIVATARWDAPDEQRHRVYAEYVGTVKHGKVTLRSEPPLTQDEVLSLLLLGSADGTIGGTSSGGGSAAATAVGAVGGAATQGLNKALSNLSALNVSTRIDSSTGSARPELVVQLSPTLSASITRALGAPAPGQPPDMTFLTFDLRIRSRWSVSALVGDRGESGLDLIWRRRY